MEKKCELCKLQARTFCESDQASLCWDCDSKVHAANFLVARHTRSLLCRLCHSPTPWSASGPNLGRAVSLCHRCSPFTAYNVDREPEDEVTNDEIDGREEEEEEEEGENQVVPLPPSSPTCSSSSSSTTSEEHGTGFTSGNGDFSVTVDRVSRKRSRQSSTDLRSLFLAQEEKRRSGLRGGKTEAERAVESGPGAVAKKFRGSCNREECGRVDVDSSEDISRTI